LILAAILSVLSVVPASRGQSAPANDNFVNAIAITGTNAVVTGRNVNATKEPGEPDHGGNPGGKSVWWYWQAPQTGCVTISTEGSMSIYGYALQSLLGVYTGSSVSNLTEIAGDAGSLDDGGSIVSFQSSPGTIYRIAVDGYTYDTPDDADCGSIVLTLTFTTNSPVNDNFVKAIAITGTNAVVTGSNVNATKEPGEPDHAGYSGGKSVWWYWRCPQSGYATISTAGSSSSIYGGPLEVLLGIYTGSCVSNLTPISCNNLGYESASFKAYAGAIYRIAVDGYSYDTPEDADCGPIVLSLTFTTNLPVAPPWSLPSIDGTTISSTDFSGDVVVLDFWATWCPYCVAEIPDLIALQQKYASDGLMVIGVSLDSSPDNVNPPTELVSSFAASNGMNYPVVMDAPEDLADYLYGSIEYGPGTYLQGIPNTFIIDRQNHIVDTLVGEQTYAIFENAVLPLLYSDLTVSMTVANKQAHIWWPMKQATFIVECTSNLSNGVWTQVSASIESDGVNQFIDIPVGPSAQFFRLQSQPTP
jgi:peroxiredoxin